MNRLVDSFIVHRFSHLACCYVKTSLFQFVLYITFIRLTNIPQDFGQYQL